MSANIIGLDIGGANLKAATAGGQARSTPFQLWKHPEHLPAALRELLRGWQPNRLAVTMTGELCDCFDTKRDGVRAILAGVAEAFPRVPISVWSTEGKFVSVDEANANPISVAAANWHALASSIVRFWGPPACPRVLIDVGSTTSDIIPIIDDQVAAIGRTDVERLRSGELIYTGMRRTPVCAILHDGVAAELFATSLDAYLLLEMVPEDPGDHETADGRPATRPCAHARLSRMLGGDPETVLPQETLSLAGRVFDRQRTLLATAIRKFAGRHPAAIYDAFVSGSGEVLALAALKDLNDTGLLACGVSWSRHCSPEVSAAACAHAVAKLMRAS